MLLKRLFKQSSDGNSNIKAKAISGIIRKFLERFLAQGVTLIVTIIIARILSPDDYSIISVTAIFFAFANIFVLGGFNTALIQKKDADSEDYSSVLHFIYYFILDSLYSLIFLS